MYRDFILSREKKGGSTASQKATSIAAVGLFVCNVKGKGVMTIVWVWVAIIIRSWPFTTFYNCYKLF